MSLEDLVKISKVSLKYVAPWSGSLQSPRSSANSPSPHPELTPKMEVVDKANDNLLLHIMSKPVTEESPEERTSSIISPEGEILLMISFSRKFLLHSGGHNDDTFDVDFRMMDPDGGVFAERVRADCGLGPICYCIVCGCWASCRGLVVGETTIWVINLENGAAVISRRERCKCMSKGSHKFSYGGAEGELAVAKVTKGYKVDLRFSDKATLDERLWIIADTSTLWMSEILRTRVRKNREITKFSIFPTDDETFMTSINSSLKRVHHLSILEEMHTSSAFVDMNSAEDANVYYNPDPHYRPRVVRNRKHEVLFKLLPIAGLPEERLISIVMPDGTVLFSIGWSVHQDSDGDEQIGEDSFKAYGPDGNLIAWRKKVMTRNLRDIAWFWPDEIPIIFRADVGGLRQKWQWEYLRKKRGKGYKVVGRVNNKVHVFSLNFTKYATTEEKVWMIADCSSMGRKRKSDLPEKGCFNCKCCKKCRTCKICLCCRSNKRPSQVLEDE